MVMMLAVVFHGMAAAHDLAAQIGVAFGFFANAEKSRPGSMAVEQVKHLRGDDGVGAVINGQGNFASSRGGGRQPRPVRPQPVAAWPQADGRYQQVIDKHGPQRPRPLPRVGDHGKQGQHMQQEAGPDKQRQPWARARHLISWQKSPHTGAPG